MKNRWAKGILLGILVLAPTLVVGCSANESGKVDMPTPPNGQQETTIPKEGNEKKEEQEPVIGNFVSKDKTFSLNVAEKLKQVDTQIIDESDDVDTTGVIYTFEGEDATLEISDLSFPDVEVDEELIREELTEGGDLNAEKIGTVLSRDGHVFYGGAVTGTSTENKMIYYRAKEDDRIISLLLIHPLSSEHPWEQEVEEMIRSFSTQ